MRRRTGEHPVEFDGYGIYRQGERTKMNPLQCVRYRAERDAMKAAFPISLNIHGEKVSVVDDNGEIINGDVDHRPGPDLTGLAAYDASEPVTYPEHAEIIVVEPAHGAAEYEALLSEAPSDMPATPREVDYDAEPLPATGQALYDWQRNRGLAARDVNDILGGTPAAFVASGGTYEGAARMILEHLSKVKSAA
jgi:hypothetical protein